MSNAPRINSTSPEKPNVLLVDDQPANLIALSSVLEDLGFNLVQAQSGPEALDLMQKMPFAVVLLDVRMPVMDGFETLQRIREEPATCHVPVIFITADDWDGFPAAKAFSLGAVDCLLKPINPVLLRGKVSGLVELSKQRQEAQSQADHLRMLLEGTIDYAIFMLDVEGRVKSWNKGAERIKGYKAQEIIGRHFSVFYPKKTAERGWPQKELEMASEKGSFEDEGWRLRKDGTPFWANVVITALRDSGGALVGFAKITRDLTERKRAEESLIQARAGLEARVAQRTAELAQANQALLDADRRKDDFLAMLSHELRGPLAPIRNALQIMKIPDIGAEAIKEARELLDRQVNNLVHIVDDLLDVSRITRGKIELRRERIELSAVFARAVEVAQPIIDAQGHELNISLPTPAVWVEGDLVRLAQVVTNLLGNAAKYTPQAGNIWLTGERDGDDVVIRVRDTGMGIEPELLPRVFHLFVQADRSLARSQGGLGIGLTLVRHLVEMHGGSVSAASAGPGKGSEIAVRLPVAKDEVAAKSDGGAQGWAGGTGPPRRVLVVDDNVDAAQSIVTLLASFGHEVESAHDGYSALAKVRAYRPEIVLLDIGLPGMSGHEVAQSLRAQPEFKDLVLVAVTGYGQEEDRRRSQEAGFDFHLTKPVGPEALAEVFTSPRGKSMVLVHRNKNGRTAAGSGHANSDIELA